MVNIFSTKTISGNPYDAMDTTFFSVFSRFGNDEAVYYTEVPEHFVETGAIKKMPLKKRNKIARFIEKLLFLRKLKPDFLFGYGTVMELPYVLCKPKNTKYIINFHSILIKSGSEYWPVRTPWFLRELLFNRADIVVAISESAKQTIINFFPDKKIEMIYSGVDLGFFVPEKRNQLLLTQKFNIRFDVPVVVYVGTLQPRKRPNVFIEIARRCENVHFVMIGRGDGVHDFLKETGDLKNFQHIERMEREDVARLFASADVFLFPSLQEPFGLVVVEAMAAGMPVIVSNSGSFSELVRDGVDGFLVTVAAHEIDNFETVLKKTLTDKNLHDTLSRNAVKDARKFSWDKTAEAYKKVLLSR